MTEREELEMWKKMYMRLLRGTEDAIDILVQAEWDCEELYINAGCTHDEYNAETGDTVKGEWVTCAVMGDPENKGHLKLSRISVPEP